MAGMLFSLIQVAHGATLNPDRTTLTFTATAGSNTPQSSMVNLSASAGTLNFAAATITNSGGSWLSVTPGSGATPKPITVTVNPGGLSAGNYTGKITLSCSPATACAAVTVNVTLTVNAPPLTVSCPDTEPSSADCSSSPLALTITGTYNRGTFTGTLTVKSSSGTIPYTATYTTASGGSWLSGDPGGTATTAGATLQLTASSVSFLPNKTYLGSVTISGGGISPIVVGITFKLQGNQIGATPNPIPIGVFAGRSSSPISLTLSYGSSTPAQQANVVGLDPFVTVSQSGSFALPAKINVSVNAASLSAGTINTGFIVQCVNTANSTCFDTPIAMQITVATAPALKLNSSVLNVPVTAGTQSAPSPVSISTTDGSSQTWTSSAPSWIAVNPPSGSASGVGATVSIVVDGRSLTPGTTPGTVTFTCASTTSCASASLTVNANVSTGAGLSTSPASLSFTAYQGRGDPQSRTLTVLSSDGSFLPFTVTGVPGWLKISATNGTTGQSSGVLTLTASVAGLPSTGASANLTIMPANSSAPYTLPVAVTMSPFSISASPNPLAVSLPAGQTQTTSLAINTVDSAPATVNVSASGFSGLSVGSSTVTAPASISISVNASGSTPATYPATITITCTAANPCPPATAGVTIKVTDGSQQPTVTPNGIVPVYSSSPNVAAGEWISIFGSNLASSTAVWNGELPLPNSLSGTSVTVNGMPAPLWFVSSAQINLQVPDVPVTGPVPVVVTTPGGSATATVNVGTVAPSFSLLGDDAHHVAAIILRPDGSGKSGNGSYDILGPTGTSLGFPTVAAKAGDLIELFGVGFGPTRPAVPAGQQPAGGSAPVISPPAITIANIPVPLSYAGLTGVGLYQINLVVPQGLPPGDQPLLATAGGVQTQPKVTFSLK